MDLPTEQDVYDVAVLTKMAEAREAGSEWVLTRTIEEMFDRPSEARPWLVRAQENGWIEAGKINEGRTITPDGLAIVERARARAADPGQRRRTLRCRLLAWVDSNVTSTSDISLRLAEFLGSRHAWFEGTYFDNGEVWQAVDYLEDRGLVHTTRGMGFGGITVGITDEGQGCATDFDSDVAAYEAAQQSAGVTYNLNAAPGGALSVAFGPHATATAIAAPVAIDAAVELAEATRQAMDVLDLEDVQAAIEDIETREPEKVKRGLGRLRDLAETSAGGALGNLLAAAAINLLAAL